MQQGYRSMSTEREREKKKENLRAQGGALVCKKELAPFMCERAVGWLRLVGSLKL